MLAAQILRASQISNVHGGPVLLAHPRLTTPVKLVSAFRLLLPAPMVRLLHPLFPQQSDCRPVFFFLKLTHFQGYVKSITPSMLAGYTAPVRLASYIYGASSQQHMIGAGDYFSGVTNPYYCAFACDVITREAKQLGDLTYRPCNYFNSWESTDNDNGSKGLVCYYYDQPQLASDGVGPEDQAQVKNSYAWSRDPQDPGEQF